MSKTTANQYQLVAVLVLSVGIILLYGAWWAFG